MKLLGYHVVAKTSSSDALDFFRERPGSVDLVITDLTMPQMTGLDLAAELLTIRSDIPIILCTGMRDPELSEKVMKAGIRELITKPLVVLDMAKTIRRVLEGD